MFKAVLFPVSLALAFQLLYQVVLLLKGIRELDLSYLTGILSGLRDWILGQGAISPWMTTLIPLAVIISLSLLLSIRFYHHKEL